MQYEYKTSGTCSQKIFFDIEDGKVKNVQFLGGCNGNLKGIGALVEGMNVDDVISRLEGTRCGMKSTSCPDQLARALKEANTQAYPVNRKDIPPEVIPGEIYICGRMLRFRKRSNDQSSTLWLETCITFFWYAAMPAARTSMARSRSCCIST